MIRAKVWKYGKNIDTEEIYPARYLVHFDPKEVAKHAMEDIDPQFSQRVKPGDIIVAGDNFGCGSAREQAAMTLKYAEVGAIIADSISRAFYRNCVNNGLPVLAMEGISEKVNEGDELEVDLEQGIIVNHTTGTQWKTKPAPKLILDIISMGGAIAYYKKNLK
ncbi:MAG TPA: 3-isopropylmalate dehydratase small subunit [Clostridia bacterium]|nr:3-isopropylmalate dehydratase small subunit [Clostridia bacterium]